MADRDKIIRYFKASGDEELAAKLYELAEAAYKSSKFKVSEFLDPREQNVAEIVAANLGGVKVEVFGGFTDAERNKVAFVAEDFYGRVDYQIEAYQLTWSKDYHQLGHRDILGACMGMGIDRSVIGDIVLNDAGAQFVADKSMQNFIMANLTSVGAASVEPQLIGLDALDVKETKVKLINGTVAALRLDAIAAMGYGVSRSKMADEIKSQNVKVNWKEAKNGAQAVAQGDIISYRSRGRVEIEEIRGNTKKGRIAITLKRYI